MTIYPSNAKLNTPAGMMELADVRDLGAVSSVKFYRFISGARDLKTEYAPVMELVDMRDLGAVTLVKVYCSVSGAHDLKN